MMTRDRIVRTACTSLVAWAALMGSVCFSAPASSQETKPTVTCWAESCSGNVCVRVQIECPREIKPVSPG